MTRALRDLLTAGIIVATAAGCGGRAAEEPASEPGEPAAEHEETTETTGLTLTPSAPGARVFFKTPTDGASVTSPFTVEFGLEGMNVVPAGQEAEHSGHHHLIVDAPLPAFDAPIPMDDHYRHFGDGSTSTTVELSPGEHTLQLLLGDHRHIPHDPPIKSEVIKVVVAAPAAAPAPAD
jgi:hypothetical protein